MNHASSIISLYLIDICFKNWYLYWCKLIDIVVPIAGTTLSSEELRMTFFLIGYCESIIKSYGWSESQQLGVWGPHKFCNKWVLRNRTCLSWLLNDELASDLKRFIWDLWTILIIFRSTASASQPYGNVLQGI